MCSSHGVFSLWNCDRDANFFALWSSYSRSDILQLIGKQWLHRIPCYRGDGLTRGKNLAFLRTKKRSNYEYKCKNNVSSFETLIEVWKPGGELSFLDHVCYRNSAICAQSIFRSNGQRNRGIPLQRSHSHWPTFFGKVDRENWGKGSPF